MAEGTYEYECMRAELLGVEKPDRDEFMKQQAAAAAASEQDAAACQEVDAEAAGLTHISGGLEELSSILQVTQKKIRGFKASCGSLTNLLKIKIGHGSGDAPDVAPKDEEAPAPPVTTNGSCSEGPRGGSDLARALDNHVDRFDALIEKAENAQYSMSYQNKEMKRFLN